ncbi:hypothetical protein GSI_09355 [Ganoderma sinense ZZ0214-1]|uniref:DUF6697 domain-containing protein n=1 Tax=Ganoderma sinense ZZ0214-1 TaxID=1077348 RepID=A0A2G8S6E5_9APHY|nr:hypothetical protein GSI_09355 [Ganoderma sinense ZZ0214-1]
MASDAVRLLEIQLDVHKRSLHEKAQRIDELEARNIDLEAQVDHLKEVVAKHQAQSKDRLGPLADLNHKRESDRDTEPETGGLSSKRRRLSPQEVVQPHSSNSNHYASRSGGQSATADVRDPNGSKHGASQPPVYQPRQSPKIVPQQPESTQEPVLPRRETLLSSSRAHPRVDPSTELELEYPVEDPGSESDPSYEPEDEDDGHTQARLFERPWCTYRLHSPHRLTLRQTSRAAFSPNPATAARLASIEPFEHGVVAKELLASTAERKAIGRRLDCKGKKTVIYRQDGTAFLALRGRLFFSALLNEWMLSGTFQVFVGLTPGKWKYMGHYALQRMHPLEGGEFESLPRGTKSHWVKDILEQKKYGTIRKDIHRRGIYGRAINAQDIIKALEQGEELKNFHVTQKLFVWRMKCIGFDYNLLRQATGVPSEEGHYQ